MYSYGLGTPKCPRKVCSESTVGGTAALHLILQLGKLMLALPNLHLGRICIYIYIHVDVHIGVVGEVYMCV